MIKKKTYISLSPFVECFMLYGFIKPLQIITLKLQVAKMRGKEYPEQKAILSFVFTYFCKICKYSYGHG